MDKIANSRPTPQLLRDLRSQRMLGGALRAMYADQAEAEAPDEFLDLLMQADRRLKN